MLTKTIISFPGLGIDEFTVDNVAFQIGEDFPIYWYGVIITLGIVSAFLYASYRCYFEKIKVDDLIDVGLWTVVLGVIGARLYYVLTTLERYIPEPFDLVQFFKNVLNLRNGGLAIYGGIICGILGIIIATRIKKMNTITLMDMAAPGVVIAQAIGRWGNFFNGEAHGGVVAENSPLYFLRMGLLPNEDSIFTTYYYHPTFLYESLWNVMGFILFNIFYKKKKFNGQIACMYLSWYGFGRMFIEGLRTDSLYVGPFRISQVVGAVCFVVFGALLIWGLIYSKKYEDPDAKLNKLDAILKPDMDKNPVFFKKKADAQTEINDEKGENENGEDN
ncbi:MAG: prolipoprotein diacylglyceryl transferase [Clostridia bacterium]|nr:prolipoprotein diacylglyceryl transferase [Clostridia bacterium]